MGFFSFERLSIFSKLFHFYIETCSEEIRIGRSVVIINDMSPNVTDIMCSLLFKAYILQKMTSAFTKRLQENCQKGLKGTTTQRDQT